MKHHRVLFIVTAVLVAACNDLAAQWNSSGNNIHNTNTGNVGIGAADPFGPLEVRKAGASSGQTVEEGRRVDAIPD